MNNGLAVTLILSGEEDAINTLVTSKEELTQLVQLLKPEDDIVAVSDIENLGTDIDNETEVCQPHFVVGIDGTIKQDVEFNWWIVDAISSADQDF